MVRTAINLYSVRELDEPILKKLDRVAAAGYDGVQFSGGLGDVPPGDIAEKLDETGLDATPPHVGIDALENDREETIRTYERFGVDAAVVPWLPAEDFASEAAVDATADRLNRLEEDLALHDWDLHYHNHSHEFADLDAGTGFDRFLARTDCGIELDVGWALVGGDDPAALLRALGGRVELVHMKDMTTAEERGFREIGEGDVDMAECARVADEIGAEWLIYEHDEPADPAASIGRGGEFLRTL